MGPGILIGGIVKGEAQWERSQGQFRVRLIPLDQLALVGAN